MTAAHCCEGASQILIYVGAYRISTAELTLPLIPITKFFMHPQYDNVAITNDFCLLKTNVVSQLSLLIVSDYDNKFF